jgi:putative nucleotidyltransferase with HDIG domain
VHDAVTFLGLTPVRGIVLASEIGTGLGSPAPDLACAVEEIYAHSLAVAGYARELAPVHQKLDAFTAGMLHDVGRLALAASAPDLFRRVRDEVAAADAPVAATEQAILEATHADLGAYLLQLWGLPLALIEPVARHHDADAAVDSDPIVAAVANADLRACMQDLNTPELPPATPEDSPGMLSDARVGGAKSEARPRGMRGFVRAIWDW